MWNLKIEDGYNSLNFRFENLVDATAFIADTKKAIKPEVRQEKVLYTLNYFEEREEE